MILPQITGAVAQLRGPRPDRAETACGRSDFTPFGPAASSTTTAVVAHTSRARLVHRLSKRSALSFVSFDDGTLGCEANHRQAWSWHAQNTETEWSIVLEDDALPVAGFDGQLQMALDVAPSPVVSLYLGRERPPYTQQRIASAVTRAGTANWIVAQRVYHAVGIAVRTELVPSLLDWLERDRKRPIDQAIASWSARSGYRVSHTWPSLVDHADLTSTIHSQQAARPRKAWSVGTRERWTGEAIEL